VFLNHPSSPDRDYAISAFGRKRLNTATDVEQEADPKIKPSPRLLGRMMAFAVVLLPRS